MKLICKWPGCKRILDYGGKGRKPKWCPEHKALAKRSQDDARRGTVRTVRVPKRPCCKDAIMADVVGKMVDGYWRIRPAGKPLRKCPQCQQGYHFVRSQRRSDLTETRAGVRTAQAEKGIGGNLGTSEWQQGNASPSEDEESMSRLAADNAGFSVKKGRKPPKVLDLPEGAFIGPEEKPANTSGTVWHSADPLDRHMFAERNRLVMVLTDRRIMVSTIQTLDELREAVIQTESLVG